MWLCFRMLSRWKASGATTGRRTRFGETVSFLTTLSQTLSSLDYTHLIRWPAIDLIPATTGLRLSETRIDSAHCLHRICSLLLRPRVRQHLPDTTTCMNCSSRNHSYDNTLQHNGTNLRQSEHQSSIDALVNHSRTKHSHNRTTESLPCPLVKRYVAIVAQTDVYFPRELPMSTSQRAVISH